jgi:hypothetical protein
MSKQKYISIALVLLMFCPVGRGFGQDIRKLDENIGRLTGKVVQYPGRTKLLVELKQAFDQANQLDLELIRQLKLTGQPDIWYQVYQANQRLSDRQETVSAITDKSLLAAGIQRTDYSVDLAESRSRAALYSYALAEKLLGESGPEPARKAYVELLKVARLKEGPYRDLDKLMRRSILAGYASMEFELYNRSGVSLNADIIGRMDKIVSDYKAAQSPVTTGQGADQGFEFSLRVIITRIDVSPDQIKEVVYGEERDIYDGELVVDTIGCNVYEYRQLKTATLTGRIDYFDKRLGRAVNSIPISVESVFTNAYAKLQGDPDAAGEETIRLLSSKQVDYPSAEEMMWDAADEFVKKAVEVILAK